MKRKMMTHPLGAVDFHNPMKSLRRRCKAAACAAFLAVSIAGTAAIHAGDPCTPHWDGTIGQPGVGGDPFPHPHIRAMTMYNGDLVAGGASFEVIGGVPAKNIGRWDGNTWHPLGSGVSGPSGVEGVVALATFQGDLYAGGDFLNAGDVPGTAFLARWDGTDWHPVGGGVDWTVESLTVFDDGNGPALYAGGWFATAGGITVNHVAKWDGNQWSPLNSGVRDGPFPLASVIAMTVFDDGSGPALYIAGSFGIADGVPGTRRVARWDGTQFSALGTGVNDDIYGITAVDAGQPGGPALYVGGWFTEVDGGAGSHVARWNGQAWTPLAQSANGAVRAVAVYDDGTGPSLYAGGWYTFINDEPFSRIARWDDDTQSWAHVGGGVNLDVTSLLVAPGTSGSPALYVGGLFTAAGDVPANRIVEWVGCADREPGIPGDLDGSGSVGVPDLLILLANWGDCPDPSNCPADLDGNGSVGVPDLLILLSNWG